MYCVSEKFATCPLYGLTTRTISSITKHLTGIETQKEEKHFLGMMGVGNEVELQIYQTNKYPLLESTEYITINKGFSLSSFLQHTFLTHNIVNMG